MLLRDTTPVDHALFDPPPPHHLLNAVNMRVCSVKTTNDVCTVGIYRVRNVVAGTCTHRVHGEIPVPAGMSIDPHTGRLQYVPEPPTAMYLVDVTARDGAGRTPDTTLMSYRLVVDASSRFKLSTTYTSGVLAGQYAFDFDPPIVPVAYVGEAYVGRSPVVFERVAGNALVRATTLSLADMFVSAATNDYEGVTFRLLFDRITAVHEGVSVDPTGRADVNPGFTVDTATGRIVGVPTAGLEGVVACTTGSLCMHVVHVCCLHQELVAPVAAPITPCMWP